MYPFLPFSSQKLHELLGFEDNIEEYGWQPNILQPGQRLMEPEPLFAGKLGKRIDTEFVK